MNKFVAVRKRSFAGVQERAGVTLEERRLLAIEAIEILENAQDAERLSSIGLSYIHPEDFNPEAENAFHRLPYVDAFVVETIDRRIAEQAREILEDDYEVAPDVALGMPIPTAWTPTVREVDPSKRWPESTGIALAHSKGVTGKGVIVGVLDTGCDADHIEFRSKRINFRYVPLNAVTDAMRAVRGFDVDGHGTHVCGILAGENIGIAPDCDLMVASVLESETLKTSLDRVLIGLDWMLSQFSQPENLSKPIVINMSLGFPPEALKLPAYRRAADIFRRVLRTLTEDFSVLAVVAIGNDGPGKMRAPGFYPECLAVGAVDFEYNVADYSGGGVSPLSGKSKPDIAGIGTDVVSAFERTLANRSRYVRMSGTSMASPYVAGIAALYASVRPDLQGGDLRQRLVASALPLKDDRDRVGAGLARYINYGG